MGDIKNLVCIVCPVGCRLTVTTNSDGELVVEGNTCKRGAAYAVKELTCPTRVLPTTVRILNGTLNRLPVRTNEAMPKHLIFEAMKEINNVCIEAPVKMGDIIIENLLDTGVNLIASRTIGTK